MGKCLSARSCCSFTLLPPLDAGLSSPNSLFLRRGISGKGLCGETPWISGRRGAGLAQISSRLGAGRDAKKPPNPAKPGWDFFSCRERLPFLGLWPAETLPPPPPALLPPHHRGLKRRGGEREGLPPRERQRGKAGAIVTPALPPAGTRPAPPSVESARRQQPPSWYGRRGEV